MTTASRPASAAGSMPALGFIALIVGTAAVTALLGGLIKYFAVITDSWVAGVLVLVPLILVVSGLQGGFAAHKAGHKLWAHIIAYAGAVGFGLTVLLIASMANSPKFIFGEAQWGFYTALCAIGILLVVYFAFRIFKKYN